MNDESQQKYDRPVKFTLTHHRKDGVTHEAFMKWIVDDHVRKAMPVFKKHGVITYALFETPTAFNGPLRQKMTTLSPTWEVADYDCIIEYTLPNAQTVEEVMADPEWLEVVSDQVDWVDTSKALLSLGHYTEYLSDRKVVNL